MNRTRRKERMWLSLYHRIIDVLQLCRVAAVHIYLQLFFHFFWLSWFIHKHFFVSVPYRFVCKPTHSLLFHNVWANFKKDTSRGERERNDVKIIEQYRQCFEIKYICDKVVVFFTCHSLYYITTKIRIIKIWKCLSSKEQI